MTEIRQSEFDILRNFLEKKYRYYCVSGFIDTDPVQIPHLFRRKEDIEISGFLTAIIAWGQRKSIIAGARRLMIMMDNAPYDFVMHAGAKELEKPAAFVYRTFQPDDCLFFISSLRNIYNRHGGLQKVFEEGYSATGSVFGAIACFRNIFFEIPHLQRSGKHVSNVEAGAAAKRINMFLRWMVRKDDEIDFGLWKNIPAKALMIPLDVHTGNTSRRLGLLTRKANDRKAVEELTANLRLFDPEDPVKYDFALFGLGVFEKNTNEAVSKVRR
jgi:uncharacterized protein (TIGR02757 family)